MTLVNLVKNLRTRLLDDTGGEGVDWQDEAVSRLLRWSNEELVDLINEAMRETAVRLKCHTDRLTINVKAGQRSYTINSKVFKIRRVKLDLVSYSLGEISWQDADAIRKDWEDYENTPDSYMLDWERGKISLYPIPLVDDTLTMNVYRYPKSDMTLENWESDEPELAEEHQRNALYWAAKLAYEKDEANSYDDGRAIKLEGTYIQHFGMPESAYALQRKKKAKRQIRYGGIANESNRDRTTRYHN